VTVSSTYLYILKYSLGVTTRAICHTASKKFPRYQDPNHIQNLFFFYPEDIPPKVLQKCTTTFPVILQRQTNQHKTISSAEVTARSTETWAVSS